VTLETVIPEMPAKSERLHRPSEHELHDAIDEIDSQIKTIRDTRKKYIDNLFKQRQNLKEIDDISTLQHVKDTKFKEKKAIKEKFDKVNQKKSIMVKEIEILKH